ncbi:MAG: hypothetical protein RJQ14_10970 [Marinoscillum sp.]
MEHLRIDSEDFVDLLGQIEESFQIHFALDEIKNNLSIEEITDLVVSKLGLNEGIECSSQIVFFRLRQLLSEELVLDKLKLTLDTKLDKLFPFRGRKSKWQRVFSSFEMDVPKLGPPMIIFLPAILSAIVSFFLIMIEFWEFGMPIFLLSLLIIYICIKFGKSLPCSTVKDLVTLVVKYDYKKTRTKYGTYNDLELRNTIFKLFTDWLTKKEIETVNFKTKIDYISK